MNIFITLDYELYFGPESGTPEKCILEPTTALLELVRPYGIKFTAFVDSGYLYALERQLEDYPELKKHYEQVSHQIRMLAAAGHGIELHVHPHWEDTFFDGEQWRMNTSRYKLADFPESEVSDIVTRYNTVLKSISGRAPVAYRAGGWCVQPFPPIGRALKKNGIHIDSSVYPKGYYKSNNQAFDFRGAPHYETQYSFSADPAKIDPEGSFVEIPISSYRVSPFFFWNFALKRLRSEPEHTSMGDGSAVPMSKKELIRYLTRPSNSVISMDGLKAGFLERSFGKYKEATANKGNFVIIGHPKAFTPFSLKVFEKFVRQHSKEHSFCTYTHPGKSY